ncbi:MAG TPA: tetratricopeptide repeat protein [Clostridiaceae bacterium]|nr:tetratricopeptide repeat protein [Clostridiaceae bacterium]
MKKRVIAVFIIFVVIWLKLICTYSINEIFIMQYNAKKYEENFVKKLFIGNFLEPYIAHYNYGNVLYKNNNYDKAIEEYNKALKLYPKHDRECKIRINLALAMLKKIDEKDEGEDNKKTTLSILNSAKEVLFEHGCANRDDNNGHNEDAEKLKKEIEEKENELLEKQETKQEDNKKEEKKEENKQNTNESEVEEKLKEIQKEVIKERQNKMERTEKMQNYTYYPGKKW